MRIYKILIVIFFCLLPWASYAQNAVNAVTVSGKYRKFAIYGGVGPSYFINNLVILKDDVAILNMLFRPGNVGTAEFLCITGI